ncbi:MAG TPA: hypothetical protein VMS98_18945 [Thermoanaerobaculia bacterium]|nr:hypothetical protein [Thermoanaerobaculia bacterium]
MKGCAVSAILQLLLWLSVSAAVMWGVRERCGIPPEESFGPAAFTGLLLSIGIGFFAGIAQTTGERRQIQRALRGQRPADGRRVGIAGTIHADAGPILAPLSGARCVAFRYNIGMHTGSSRTAHFAVLYEGVAVTPSSIRTASGRYRLLAVPVIDGPAESLDSAAKRRAADHIRTATFADPQPAFTRPQVEKEWSDDDGSYRHERRRTDAVVDLEKCTLTESVVREGAKVCVFGRYSAERGGIVADRNWAKQTRVMTTDPAAAAHLLGKRSLRYAIAGVIFCAAAAGVAFAAFDRCW